jgi:hypothetical protein
VAWFERNPSFLALFRQFFETRFSRPQRRRFNEERLKLNKLNWINLALFVLNFIFIYGIGDRGGLARGTITELSAKYQTLLEA